MVDKPEPRHPTTEGYDAEAMLLGMIYDERDHTFNTMRDDAPDEVLIDGPFLCAETLEPVYVSEDGSPIGAFAKDVFETRQQEMRWLTSQIQRRREKRDI